MEKLNYVIMLFIFLFFNLQTNFCQVTSHEKKKTTIIIMPFDFNARYPYSTDEIRQALIMSFSQKDFKIVDDFETWDYLIKSGYQLVDMQNELADSIYNKFNIDLIAFGVAKKQTDRAPGVGGESEALSKVLIKVYDGKLGKMIFRDRVELKSRWGLLNQTQTTKEFGDNIALKIKNMKY